jgi:hypothetical protein
MKFNRLADFGLHLFQRVADRHAAGQIGHVCRVIPLALLDRDSVTDGSILEAGLPEDALQRARLQNRRLRLPTEQTGWWRDGADVWGLSKLSPEPVTGNLDRAEGSENKARQEVDGSPCRRRKGRWRERVNVWGLSKLSSEPAGLPVVDAPDRRRRGRPFARGRQEKSTASRHASRLRNGGFQAVWRANGSLRPLWVESCRPADAFALAQARGRLFVLLGFPGGARSEKNAPRPPPKGRHSAPC